MTVDVRRTPSGGWAIYVRGNFISDHASHQAARQAAQQIAHAESPDVSRLP